MREDKDALLIARYCVEDGSEDRVRVDVTSTVEFDRFKSILRNLLGSYELIPAEALEKKYAKILEVG